MIADPERLANEYELDAKANIDNKIESGSVSIVAMRIWLRAAHAVVELTGPADGNGKTFGSDGNILLWLHESDLALGNILLNRISKENAKLRELAVGMYGMFEMFDKMLGNHDACETPRPLVFGEDKSFKDVMRELGVEVD